MTPHASPISGEQLRMVLDVSRMLASATELDPLLLRTAEAAATLLTAERASIWLFDDKANQLWTKVALGAKEIRVPRHAGIVGAAFEGGQLVHVPKPYEDPRFNPEPDRRSGFVTRNILSAPLKDLQGTVFGVMQVINKVGGDFSEDDKAKIKIFADEASVHIQRFQLQMAAMEIFSLRREMDLARKVQEALLPKSLPSIPGLAATGWTRPAVETGGDCFDLWRMSDGRLGVFLADASGHGLAPALVVSQARTLVRAMCEIDDDPHKLLSRVNRRMAEDLETGRFVTAFVGFVHPAGRLDWSSAGQAPIFYRGTAGDELETLVAAGPPLGILDDWPGEPPPPVQLGEGGSLYVISDGIFEAMDGGGEQYGVERVIRLLDAHRDGAPGTCLASLRDDAQAWQGGLDPADDQTIVVVTRERGA